MKYAEALYMHRGVTAHGFDKLIYLKTVDDKHVVVPEADLDYDSVFEEAFPETDSDLAIANKMFALLNGTKDLDIRSMMVGDLVAIGDDEDSIRRVYRVLGIGFEEV